MAGNIGAKAIQAAASDLEKIIRARSGPADVESAKQATAAVLDPLVEQLRTSLTPTALESPAPSEPSAAVDPAQTREAVMQLARLLSEFDPGATGFIETNLTALRPLFAGEAWEQFKRVVQDYSFADAQALLEQALKRIPQHEKTL